MTGLVLRRTDRRGLVPVSPMSADSKNAAIYEHGGRPSPRKPPLRLPASRTVRNQGLISLLQQLKPTGRVSRKDSGKRRLLSQVPNCSVRSPVKIWGKRTMERDLGKDSTVGKNAHFQRS